MALIFNNSPEPPYYSVTFFAELTGIDVNQYREIGDQLLELARQQPGFLGYDDQCAGGNYSFNISYWDSLEAIHNWKKHPDHLPVQAMGKKKWYQWYEVKIARIERAYSFDRDP